MAKQSKAEKEKGFREELVTQLLTLSTSGFGLVAALAWNSTIQQLVQQYIQPHMPGYGVLSQLLYAVLITCLAVLITYQLSRLASRLHRKQ